MPSWFRLFRVRSPLLAESLLFSSPPGTEMVHFPGFASPPYFIQMEIHEFCSCGFPHSEICGSKGACPSPQLFAACHVLHRLEVPRHPPCALSSLTVKFTREQRLIIADCQLPISNLKTNPTLANYADSRANLSVHLHSKNLPCVF